MKFLDINCMIGEWGFERLRFKTGDELTAIMGKLGIEKAVVFDSKAWLCDITTGNRAVIAETQKHENLVPAMVLTPLINQEFGGKNKLLDYMEANGVGAVRLFPVDHNYTMHLWNVRKLFSLLNEIRIPVLLECREMKDGIMHLLGDICEVAGAFPDTPIVLLTPGYRSMRIFLELFEAYKNIYIDTSTFITYHGIEEITRLYGSERILFGTRMPFIDAGVSVGRIIYADISDEEKENIAYGNAARLIENCSFFKGRRVMPV